VRKPSPSIGRGYPQTDIQVFDSRVDRRPCATMCVFIACGLKIIAADVEHGAIASQTWGSSDALSNEDMRMVLNWESLDTLCLNALGLN